MLSYFLFGEIIFPLVVILASIFNNEDANIDPKTAMEDQEFYKSTLFMFPENFTSRYPSEVNPYRLKILGYLVFNLLVKGYASESPDEFWSSFNTNDPSRVVLDSVFYEYLTNFTDREMKEVLFDPLESSTSSPLMSNEEIVVDRIGEYLDLLSEAKLPSKDPVETDDTPAESQSPYVRCDVPQIQTSGIPGKDFPDHCHIPETSFSCSDKHVPGIYADLEAGCQVFHVCWLHRMDSFLCPIGTTFNPTLLTCEIWHDSECSSSASLPDGISSELEVAEYDGTCLSLLNTPLRLHAKFLPAKCKVTDLKQSPETTDKAATKPVEKPPKETDQLKEKMETGYLLAKNIVEMLKKMVHDLDDELTGIEFPWIPRFLKPTRKPAPVIKKRGDTVPSSMEQELYPEQLSSSTESSGTLQKSTKLLESSKDVPEIVSKSLELAGTLLSDDIIPLAKQIIIDSYRKIESKNH